MRTTQKKEKNRIKSLELNILHVADMIEAEDGSILLISNDEKIGGTGKCVPSCYDLILSKIDPSGHLVFMKAFGGVESDSGARIKKTSDGGFIIVGSTSSSIHKGNCIGDRICSDLWLLKFDASGELSWQYAYDGKLYDAGADVLQTEDNGFIAVGNTASIPHTVHCEDPNQPCFYGDGWIIKVDKNGDRLWEQTTGGVIYDGILSIAAVKGGGFVVAGLRDEYEADGDAFLQRFDSAGRSKWSKVFFFPDEKYFFDLAESVFQTADGKIMAAGISDGFSKYDRGIWIRKYSVNGNLIWQKLYSLKKHDIDASQILQTKDGGLIIVGYIEKSNGGTNSNDYYILKTSADGEKQWEKIFGGPGENGIDAVVELKSGGYLIAGANPYKGITRIIKIDSNGNVIE